MPDFSKQLDRILDRMHAITTTPNPTKRQREQFHRLMRQSLDIARQWRKDTARIVQEAHKQKPKRTRRKED